MRVLHVIGAMDRGGAETMVMNLYRAMDRSRIQFDFLVHEQRECDYDEEIRALGGHLYRLPRFTGSNLLAYRRMCREFFAEHDEHAIVHGHIASCAAVYLAEANRAGRATIAHSHAQNYPLSIPELGFRIVSFPTRFVANRFLACSLEAGRDRFGDRVVSGDAFDVVKNAIDVGAYEADAAAHEQAKERLGFAGAPLVGHVGRFDPVKNHRFLIDVFSKVAERVPEARLVLVGRGPIEQEVRAQVREAGLDERVVFYGVTDRVPDVLKALDAFVFPSFAEGLSMAAVEAQAAGASCVLSTGVPELAVVAPELAERLQLEQGASAWVDATVRALEGSVDRTLGAQGARACGYDIARTSRWLASYYEALTSEGARRHEEG